MNKIRVVFMGTPEFAVASLKAILENNFNIVGVITAPDKPAGRGRKIQKSAVKIYAQENNLKILQPTNLKDTGFLQELKDLRADIQVVVAFRMLPKIVWNMPRLGTFNLHASLLPNYRGAAPINWAIINGENKTGVTTFFINENIDTGDVILQKDVSINKKDTAGDLHDKLMTIGSDLVVKTLEMIINNQIEPSKQNTDILLPAPKLFKDNCKIDWNDSLLNIYNKIRGLSPFPAAWTFFKNNEEVTELKLYKSEMEEVSHKFDNGLILSNKKELKVAVPGGFIQILELKIAGKRKMDTKSFLNGYKVNIEAKML